MSELLSISRLVQETGVPRTSIHFYLREGLLPQPQRQGTNRALYSQDHVRILKTIKELKAGGLSLADVREALADELATIEDRDIDLVRQENERVRETIVRVATEEFMSQGYGQARIADIIRKSGVNTKLFYGLFPSKAELLVESFKAFVTWQLAFVEPGLEGMDPGERLLRRLHADIGHTEFGSSVLSVWSEAPGRPDLIQRVQEAFAPLANRLVEELGSTLRPEVEAPVPLELLAYSLIGANNHSSRRATWDDRYSREDVLATHLWLFLTVLDALKRQTEADPYLTRYAGLISEVAASGPVNPPPPSDELSA